MIEEEAVAKAYNSDSNRGLEGKTGGQGIGRIFQATRWWVW